MTALAAAAALLAAASQAAPPPPAPAAPRVTARERLGALTLLTVASPAVAASLDQAQQPLKLAVLLPPSYETAAERRYPVVYFLPGFNGSPSQVSEWREWLADAFKGEKGAAGEFIVVGVDGRTPMGGSFYVRSAVNGDFEAWVVQEAIAVVDAAFRTVPRREARGLAGFSMGGFGALHLALRHPDVYACAYAISPGVLKPGALEDAWETWDAGFKEAYGRAFAPEPSDAETFCAIPTWDGSPADAAAQARWREGFDGWKERLDAYAKQGRRLRAVHLEVGTDDMYPWIVEGTRWLAGQASERRLGWELEEFAGGHEVQGPRLAARLAPFFQRCLTLR